MCSRRLRIISYLACNVEVFKVHDGLSPANGNICSNLLQLQRRNGRLASALNMLSSNANVPKELALRKVDWEEIQKLDQILTFLPTRDPSRQVL